MDQEKIKSMRQGGKILSIILKTVESFAKPGVSARELDEIAYDKTIKAGARPAFLTYEKFPSSLCVSINDEIVHGVPSKEKILKEGDVLKLDFGILFNGYFIDAATTVPIGKVSLTAKKLIYTAKSALDYAINVLVPGMTTGDLGWEIENYVNRNGFFVVKELVGHSIGKKLHEEPKLPNFGKKNQGAVLKAGDTLAIEPMISARDTPLIKGKDGFVYKTKDGSLTAHFEHTVLLTDSGAEVLTL